METLRTRGRVTVGEFIIGQPACSLDPWNRLATIYSPKNMGIDHQLEEVLDGSDYKYVLAPMWCKKCDMLVPSCDRYCSAPYCDTLEKRIVGRIKKLIFEIIDFFNRREY